MGTPTVFDRIVELFGTQAKLADKLGVTPQSIQKYKRQIPAERVLEIERLTGGAVTRHEMRPDVFGDAAA